MYRYYIILYSPRSRQQSNVKKQSLIANSDIQPTSRVFLDFGAFLTSVNTPAFITGQVHEFGFIFLLLRGHVYVNRYALVTLSVWQPRQTLVFIHSAFGSGN